MKEKKTRCQKFDGKKKGLYFGGGDKSRMRFRWGKVRGAVKTGRIRNQGGAHGRAKTRRRGRGLAYTTGSDYGKEKKKGGKS